MKKIVSILLAAVAVTCMLSVNTFAAAATHTVVSGESLWKIAVRYQVGLSEIKSANPQIKNFDLIYPGQIINIPKTDEAVANYEQEVIRLVNEVRVQNGLKPLTYDWELGRVARYKSQDMKDDRYFAHTSKKNCRGVNFIYIKGAKTLRKSWKIPLSRPHWQSASVISWHCSRV